MSGSGLSVGAFLLAGAGLGSLHKAGNRQRTRSGVAAEPSTAPPVFKPAEQIGAMAPLGYFDPLGFAKDGDEKGFRQLRAAELKHGRVAMMASVGLLGQHFIKFPFFERVPAGFSSMVYGEAILGFTGLLTACAVVELAWREEEGKEPGNFGDPFGVKMYNEEMRSKEISNGRFAMICVFGIFAAELASGKDAIQQFGLGALARQGTKKALGSCLAGGSLVLADTKAGVQRRAAAEAPIFKPAEQIGAMAPLGYFDPLGFAKDGDEKGFRQLRAAELKHGRVAMMASVGLLGQHFIKFPFFERVPAGFSSMVYGEAILGFMGLLTACAVLELAWREEEGKEPGNFGDPFGVNMYNEEMRSKEISNGRFAMICVFGIFAAELASGKDAIQQFGLGALARQGMKKASGSCLAGGSLVLADTRAAVQRKAAAEAPIFKPAEQIGAMAPLGYFDPLGFAKDGDEKGFRQLRAAELKHGRVAMMASVGLLGQHFLKFPFFERVPAGFSSMVYGEAILGFTGLLTACAVLELAWREEEGKEPGNFGDPFGVNMYNKEMRSKEISNGRFAMICVFGIFAAELASGKDAIQQFGL